MTTQFTITDLERILGSGAETTRDRRPVFDGQVLDTAFSEIGYDSLALLELAGRIQREYGVPMPDDAHTQMTTPRRAIDFINSRLADTGVSGGSTGHTDNSILIDAPIELVWEMTNDIESWPRLFSEYSAAEIIERRGDTVVFRLVMHPDGHGQVWTWVSERTPDPTTRTVRARRVETGPFEHMDIFWQYTQESGGVRMRWVQDFHMKPAAPVDDRDMTKYLDRSTAIHMQGIKEKVEAAAVRRSDLRVDHRSVVP
jgi:aromatase